MEKELLYKSAEKSLANKDYFKAAEELSKLYVEYGEKNFRINYLLFISFKNLNEHERAVETAEECLESYMGLLRISLREIFQNVDIDLM